MTSRAKHFKSLSRSFRYEQSQHDISVDFELDNRAFGLHKSKFRAVLCNAALLQGDDAASHANATTPSVAYLVCVDVVAQKRLAAAKETLLRELRVAMALRHANLNTVHGFCDFDRDSFYIVEEFYDLGDCEVLKRLGLRWTEPAVAKWCKDVLLALAFLHSKGVAYEHLSLSNIVVNHRGRVKLTCTALLSAIGAADTMAAAAAAANSNANANASSSNAKSNYDAKQTVSDGDIGIRWAVARSQYASSRARDMLDFVVLTFDLFRLRWQTWESTLRTYFGASAFMTDFFQRLHKCDLDESKTLSADMLLGHPFLKPANDKANERAMLSVVAQAKAARRSKRAQRPAAAAPSADAPTQTLALSISVPLLGLRNELFEFRNHRVEIKAGKHNVDRIKRLVMHHYVKNVMLPATTHAGDFYFVVPRKHARAVRLDDALQFSDYRGLRGRNGEFRLVLLQEGGANSNRMPEAPSSPPASPGASMRSTSPRATSPRVSSPRSPRESRGRARPRSMSPRRAASPPLSPRGARVGTSHYTTRERDDDDAAPALVTQSERQPSAAPLAVPTVASLSQRPPQPTRAPPSLTSQASGVISPANPLTPHRVPPAPLQGTRALSPMRAAPQPNERPAAEKPYVSVSPLPVATPPQPPSEALYGNWVAAHTPAGAKYYYNRELDLSSWKHPSTMTSDDMQKLKAQARSRSIGNALTADQSARNSEVHTESAPSPISSRHPSTYGHATLSNEELETLVMAEVRPLMDAKAESRRREWDAFAATNDTSLLQRTAALRPVVDEDLTSDDDDDDGSASGDDDEDGRRNIAPLVFSGDSSAPERPKQTPMTLGREEGDVLRSALQQASMLRAKLDMKPNSGKNSLNASAATAVEPPSPPPNATPSATTYQRIGPFRVVALFENVPEHAGELAFDQDDTITVFAEEGGWYEGQHDDSGVTGWFSSNYCRKVEQ
jgi:serine/threonine protein kinase